MRRTPRSSSYYARQMRPACDAKSSAIWQAASPRRAPRPISMLQYTSSRREVTGECVRRASKTFERRSFFISVLRSPWRELSYLLVALVFKVVFIALISTSSCRDFVFSRREQSVAPRCHHGTQISDEKCE